MACDVSTSHPPCPKAWVLSPVELFADLRWLPCAVPLPPDFSLVAHPLAGSADALGCGKRSTLSSRPPAGLVTRFRFCQGGSGRPDSRFCVAQSRGSTICGDWVESGVVSPRSARCSRASPITGTRLRTAIRVPAGGGFPVDRYRDSGMCWRTFPTARMAAAGMWRHPRFRTVLLSVLTCIANRPEISGISSSVLRTQARIHAFTLSISRAARSRPVLAIHV